MEFNREIEAVDVYLQRRKSREYVGRLFRKGESYVYLYDMKYLYRDNSIPIGPDLPLSTKKFVSKKLFLSFEDRIPSRENPAYKEYCEMVGISVSEKNPLVLVATLGQKGPSSFIFAPVFKKKEFSFQDVINFRKKLQLTVREFSELFDFSPATIHKIEKNKTSGKDAMKRLEIYYLFPEVAIYEAKKNKNKINDEKLKHIVTVYNSLVRSTR